MGELIQQTKSKYTAVMVLFPLLLQLIFFFQAFLFPVFLWQKNYCLKCAPSSFSSKTITLI